MTYSFAGVFADAGALWRQERRLLLPLAAIFYFLPVFAMELFLTRPDTAGLEREAATRAAFAWIGDNIHWLSGQVLCQLFGSAALLILLLDARRPTVGQAMTRAFVLLPGLIALTLATSVLTVAGLFLFIVPGLYAAGRTFLAAPVLLAEPQRGPLGALVAGIQRSEHRGWAMFLIAVFPLAAATLLTGVLDGLSAGLGADAIPLLDAAIKALACAVSAAAGLAHALLQAAAYRRTVPVSGPRQGM